ncbi:MAG: penicillin-binding protein 2 [Gammaproteobacteria bacterium HGW-Gammaproteobacteria-1]|jgi:penicillin-binding protein 2|nr:MAG: penicillin-binding protein 2 [Gammaproteobacteria bacterium HGW-Gammaproteobacteria-1]
MFRGAPLRNPQWENYLFKRRVIVAALFSIALIAFVIIRLFFLQVINHEHYTTLSRNNRVDIQPIAPTRGLIYDRNGVILAENQPTFSLEIVPERVDDMEATLTAIRELITVSDSDMERFRQILLRKRRFEETPLRLRLSDEEVARIAVNRYRLPGVEIKSRLARDYPLGALLAHTLGYVGRIDERELQQLDTSNYAATAHIGKTGVEKTYENELHGKVGYQQVETNARGRVLRVLERTPPVPGRNLHLNIDVRLQQAAQAALGNEHGALVAIDPSDGAVLALVSLPSFDPNLFVNGIDTASYDALANSKEQPLFNRALNGQYPPGSTIKPLYGLLGLESGEIRPDTQIWDEGFYMLKGDERRYRDWKKEGHGWVDLNKSIVESCDVYYYELALTLGIDRMSDFMRAFGFGRPTGVDLTGESSGLMPSREWKRRVHRQPWFPGETLITGIGQGFTLTTPLQLASSVATLASFGRHLSPNVVAALEESGSGVRTPLPARELPPVRIVDNSNWQRIHRAMTAVVHSPTGTARSINRNLAYTVAGKTGTAQVFGIKQDEEYVAEDIAKHLRDHALFVAFAPTDRPRIAVAVIVENGGGGGAIAAPMARKVMDTYLLDGEGRLREDLK